MPTPRLILHKKDLIELGKPNLQRILRGIHNISFPTNMIDLLNADELVAKYFAIGHFKGSETMKNLPREFFELIKAFDNYSYPKLGKYMSQWDKRYSNKKNEQIERLSDLSELDKDAFILSFFLERRIPSLIEDKTNPNAYYELESWDKKMYADQIYNVILD